MGGVIALKDLCQQKKLLDNLDIQKSPSLSLQARPVPLNSLAFSWPTESSQT